MVVREGPTRMKRGEGWQTEMVGMGLEPRDKEPYKACIQWGGRHS